MNSGWMDTASNIAPSVSADERPERAPVDTPVETVDPAVTNQLETRALMLKQLAEQRAHLHQSGALPDAARTIGEPVERELARLRAGHDRGGVRNENHARRAGADWPARLTPDRPGRR